MYTYESQHKNHIATTIAFILTVLAFGAIIFVAANPIRYAVAVQLSALVLLTIAIYLVTSFTLKSYIYKVDFRKGNGESVTDGYDFYIIEKRGKRNIILVRIDLKYIRAIARETKENSKSLRDGLKSGVDGTKFYTYCPDLYPKDAVWVYFDGVCDGVSGDIAIRFCPDEKLCSILAGFLEKQ